MFSKKEYETKPQPVSKKDWLLRCVGLFLLIASVLSLLILAGSWAIGEISMLNKVSGFLNSIRPWLYSGQLSLIAVLWWKWDAFVSWLERRGTITASMRCPLLAARHRIMRLILVIQVFVVMNVPFHNPFAVY